MNKEMTKFYWKNKYGYIRCYMSYGYDKRITSLIKLFEAAKKEFPNIKENEFEVIEIINSDTVKHYTCLSFLVDEEPNDSFVYLEAS